MQLFTDLSPVQGMIYSFALVIVLQALKDAVEDIIRYISDKSINLKKVDYLNPELKRVQRIYWKDVKVGDILRIHENETVPADLICLAVTPHGAESSPQPPATPTKIEVADRYSMIQSPASPVPTPTKSTSQTFESSPLEHFGVLFIETSQIDGESTLKIKRALNQTMALSEEELLTSFKAKIECEGPNAHLYHFDGTLHMMKRESHPSDASYQESDTSSSSSSEPQRITVDNQLPRNCKIRNCAHIYGVAVYTGDQTKVMIHGNSHPPRKRSKLERLMNHVVGFLLVLMIVSALVGAIASTVFTKNNMEDEAHWYIFPGKQFPYSLDVHFIRGSFTFFLLYSMTIPTMLYISLEIVKTIQTRFFIEQDINMYDPATNKRAIARTSDINEELGNVQYILSDKTGTLTKNRMKFVGFYCGEKYYGDDSKHNFHDDRILNSKWKQEEGKKDIKKFLLLLSVCHSAVMLPGAKGEEYHSQSPDEIAILKALREVGIKLIKRSEKTITLNFMGETMTFEYLNVLDYTSARKRMTVIIRDITKSNDSPIWLITKGADSAIIPCCDSSNTYTNKAWDATHAYSYKGYRTLVCAYKTLTEEMWKKWNEEHYRPHTLKIVSAAERETKENQLSTIFEMLETNMRFLGVTAVEDELQDNVAQTLSLLSAANIKVWMLTGDKYETAVSIAYSCSLFKKHTQIFSIKGITSEEAIMKELESTLNEMKKLTIKSKTDLGFVIDSASLHTIYHLLKRKTAIRNPVFRSIRSYFVSDVKSHEMGRLLYEITKLCSSVILCRVSPFQKAFTVDFLRYYSRWHNARTCFGYTPKSTLRPRTVPTILAVGDGANDVQMIQKADVGIGIFGEEGMQAARAADFAISQFQYLKNLILVHGRMCNRRVAILIGFFIFKASIMQFLSFFYMFFNGYSGETLYENSSHTVYHVVWTAFAVILTMTTERDVTLESSLTFPELYRYSQSGSYLNYRGIVYWMFTALWQSVILFFGAYLALGDSIIISTGKPMDFDHFSYLMFIALILVVNFKLMFYLNYWNFFTVVIMIGQQLLYPIFLLIYCALQPLFPKDKLVRRAYMVVYECASSAQWWFTLVFLVFLILLIEWILGAIEFNCFPKLYHAIQSHEAYQKKPVTREQVSKSHPRLLKPASLPVPTSLLKV